MNEENNKVFASADYCRKLKADIAELEEKHWNECRQIAHYDDELRQSQKSQAIREGQDLIRTFAKTVMAILDANNTDEATLEFDHEGRHFIAEMRCSSNDNR